MPTDVFISYSSNDQDKVVKLADKLRAAGVSIWMDESGIGAATLWSKEIAGAIKSCKVLVLMVTPNSVKSKNVVREVSLASEQNKQILPVVLEITQIPEALEYHLAGIQHLDVSEMSPSDSAKEILPALQRLLGLQTEEAAEKTHKVRLSRRRSFNIWTSWQLYACTIMTAAAAAVLVWLMKPESAPKAPRHSDILVRSSALFSARKGDTFALSRDGKSLVYSIASVGGGLRIRDFATGFDNEIRVGADLVEGFPFFSWEGSKVGFLKLPHGLATVSISGGNPKDLGGFQVTGGGFQGAAWGMNGEIVFAHEGDPLKLVTESVGEVQRLTELEGNTGHAWPQFLPDGDHVLFIAQNETSGSPVGRIEVVNISTFDRTDLGIGGCSFVRYSVSGHLLYVVDDAVFAVPFDVEQLKVNGIGKMVMQGVLVNSDGRAQFDVADDGTLLFLERTDPDKRDRTLLWIDSENKTSPFTNRSLAWTWLDLSPDEKRVAIETEGDIWILDKDNNSLRPLVRNDALDRAPLWSADNESIYFYSNRDGKHAVWKKAADFSHSPAQLICEFGSSRIYPTSLSEDDYMVMAQRGLESRFDIWGVSGQSEEEAKQLLSEEYTENWPMISPDGKWLAYSSTETGNREIFIKPLTGSGGSQMVSEDGGVRSRWSKDGQQLYYSKGGAIFSVSLSIQDGKMTREGLVKILTLPDGADSADWFISSDNKRFLVSGPPSTIRTADEAPETYTRFRMISNWFTELNEKMPVE